jgi:hypothetical protein
VGLLDLFRNRRAGREHAIAEPQQLCVVCNVDRPASSFPTYDHPAITGKLCDRHPTLICSVCRDTYTPDLFTAFLCGLPTGGKVPFRRPTFTLEPTLWGQTKTIYKNPSPQRCDFCARTSVCRLCGAAYKLSSEVNQQYHHLDDHKRRAFTIQVHRDNGYRCWDCRNLRSLTDAERTLLAEITTPPAPPDPTTPAPHLTLGTTPEGATVTITDTDRTRHLYLIGGTGSGKSVTLTNLATQDIRAGRGLTVIDPHGDLVANPDPERGGLLYRVPTEQLDRLTYFNPIDEDAPAFNLLASDFEPDKLTADLVATFKMFFGDSWGHQMEHLLRHALLTLLADRGHEPHSLADLYTLLTDADYRDTIVRRAAPEYAAFWHHEYPQLTKDAARPILTRLGSVLVPGSAIRRVVSHTTNALDVRAIMDGGKILLVNLSKGALGEQPAKLLGGLIVTAITQAALSRQRLPEKDRTPHTLYCDEFQNFADLPSTGDILSEARKYQLRLVLAHQTMSQVNDKLMSLITGNVKTVVGFNTSPEDARKLSQRMGRTVYVHPQTNQRHDLTRERAEAAAAITRSLLTFPYSPGTTYVHPSVQGLFDFLTNTATADPLTYRPPDAPAGGGKTKPWKQDIWPEARDFQNLATCRAFIMRNVAESTCELTVPFPPPAPYPDNLDRWHARRAAEIAAHLEKSAPPTPTEQKRPLKTPQERRNAIETTLDPHQNPTTFDDAAGDALHSTDDEAPTHQPPPRRLPRPRGRA